MAVFVLSKNEKIIYTSVNPSFTIYKMGFTGINFMGVLLVLCLGAEIICKFSSFMCYAWCFKNWAGQ